MSSDRLPTLDPEDRLQQVARVAAHDLREPLRAVAGFAELIAEDLADTLDDRTNQYLAHLSAGVERMQTMVDGLLAWLRAGQDDLEMSTVDLDEVVAEGERSLRSAGRAAGAEISIGALPTVTGDRHLLHQLFHHLLANALTFRRPEGTHRVEVMSEHRDGAWWITVADSGIGIDPRHRSRVFELFERLHTRDEFPGTGTGLAICRTVALRHGGTIALGEGIDGGAAVTVTLPGASVDGSRPVPSEG